jgi:hypothetical protein
MEIVVTALAWPNGRAAVDGGRKDQGIPRFRLLLLHAMLDVPRVLA